MARTDAVPLVCALDEHGEQIFAMTDDIAERDRKIRPMMKR
jgi:hypothetical protein